MGQGSSVVRYLRIRLHETLPEFAGLLVGACPLRRSMAARVQETEREVTCSQVVAKARDGRVLVDQFLPDCTGPLEDTECLVRLADVQKGRGRHPADLRLQIQAAENGGILLQRVLQSGDALLERREPVLL